MSEQADDTAGLHSFERNNYFYGKLLTVRDMATEQAYHTGIRRTLSRYVTDWGGVCGLDVETAVTSDEETDEQSLVITVFEGLALDRCGRLIVVAEEKTKTLALPVHHEGEETDTVGVFVEWDECFTEPVPVAKTESACETECCENRVVQGAEVTVEPGPPDVEPKSVADIEFPEPLDLGVVDDRGADQVTVSGELETRSYFSDTVGELSLDLAFAEGADEGTATLDVTIDGIEQLVSGRLTLPEGQFLDDEGVMVPDGDFEITGSLTILGENDERTTEFTGDLSVSQPDGQVAIDGTLDRDPDTAGEFDFDLTVDRTADGFGIDERVTTGDGESQVTYKMEVDATVTPTGDDYLVSGDLSYTVIRGSGAETTEYTVFTVSTTEWERAGEQVDGLYVDVPERPRADLTEAAIDHILTEMARSYYADERVEACPETDDGPILVGTVTRTGETWETTAFERGPLVYTNDMLYDVLARHVTDFENPHDVMLEVGDGADAGPGPDGERVDASVGVEGPDGPTGTVGLTSSDDSIDLAADRATQTVDFTADVGLDEEFEAYYVRERSLWNTAEAYSELVEDSVTVQAPQAVTHFAFRIARVAKHAIEQGVHESAAAYREFFETPHTDFYPEQRIPNYGEQTVDGLQATLLNTVGTSVGQWPPMPVRRYEHALGVLTDRLDAQEGTVVERAHDVARAQDRVAAAADGLLNSHPSANYGFGIGGEAGFLTHRPAVSGYYGIETQPRAGRGVVADLRDQNLTRVVRVLDLIEGWTYLVRAIDADVEGELRDFHVNQVTEQTPDADEVRHKAAGIRLGVIEPPGPQRIDGIGDITAEELARGGIETVSELASANPEAVRVLTGASGETARDWRERADRYSANYVLTHVQQIGLLEAEAFAEVSLFSDHRYGSLSSLSDVAYDELVQEVTALEEETAFKSKYATAIRELTWDVVEESLERIRQG